MTKFQSKCNKSTRSLAFQKLAEEETALNEREEALTACKRALDEAQPDLSLSMA
jgi:hypothetical protein